MSLVKDIQNTVTDNLIATSSLQWIPYSQITDIKSSQIDNVCYGILKQTNDGRVYEKKIMLLWLGHDEMCTPTFVSEFARIYSLPTQKYKDNFGQFKRYKKWLSYRNDLTIGFTEHENNHYMVADRNFSHCYSRYGFCSACGILRCSPVWCVCGYK